MFKTICAMGATVAMAGGGMIITGCGSSSPSPSHSGGSASATASPDVTTTSTSAAAPSSGQALVEAADHIDETAGYRMAAKVTVHAGSGSVAIDMNGVIGDHGQSADLTSRETLAGHTFNLRLLASGGTYYMSGVPGLSRLSQGRKWISYNLADAEKAQGLTGLQNPTSSNPAQFVRYLKTVGSVRAAGTSTIDGVKATEYRATLNFDRYPQLVPASQRAAARTAIATVEKAIGTHTLPVTAWVDSAHQLRRMQMRIPECVAGQHLSMSMTMDLSDLGQVPAVSAPSASDTYDITPLIKSAMGKAKSELGGCSAS